VLIASMAIFAFVIAAAALVGVWLIISYLSARARGWESRLERHAADIQSLRTTTPSALGAEVDDLRAALETQRASNRKELGSLWARVGGRPLSGEFIETRQAPNGDFEAMLALQSAPVVKPQ